MENLQLLGWGLINATGNAGDNVLMGNVADNLLDGRAGADRMVGGSGNDAYVVDHAGDVVVEISGGGTDTVYAGVSHTLAPNVETLQLIGFGKISGTGNALDNILVSNGGGNNLAGGLGTDSYVVHSSADQVIEKAGEGNNDTVYAYASFTLSNHVENLLLVGSGKINGLGTLAAMCLQATAPTTCLMVRPALTAWLAGSAMTAMGSIMPETWWWRIPERATTPSTPRSVTH